MPNDLVLRSTRVVLPSGVQPASIRIADGRIQAIEDYHVPCTVDTGDDAILPGLVDTHVHINEPGRTDWEGFATATRAAAAGGITTLIEMPLNSAPATTTVAAFEEKLHAASSQCMVNVGFWGGVVPGNQDQLAGLFQAGCFGFKCFLSPSGIAEFQHVTEEDLQKAMPVLAQMGAVLLAHAEMPAHLQELSGDARIYRTYLETRPPLAEQAAIDLLIRLSKATSCRVHVVHLACSEALAPLRAAKREGVPITVETCPHYLTFSAEQVPNGAPEYKCAPPIRNEETREALWNALRAREIDAIVSDHSPCPPDFKSGENADFLKAWGGISSLQIGLPVVWTGAEARGFTLQDVSSWMSAAPARLAGLAQKGAIAVGNDADLVIFAPAAEWTVQASALHHKHKVTPYDGQRLRGLVKATYLKGALIQLSDAPRGQILRRNPE